MGEEVEKNQDHRYAYLNSYLPQNCMCEFLLKTDSSQKHLGASVVQSNPYLLISEWSLSTGRANKCLISKVQIECL